MKKILSLVFVLFLALSLFSGCASKNPTVMTVGETEISAQEYNYTYYAQLQEFYASYSGYLTYFGLDPDKPLKDQPCTLTEEQQSWADFFMTRTEDLLSQVFCFYNAAVAEGMTLGESYVLQLDAFVLAATEAAAKAGQTLDEYLSENYGPGLKEEQYRLFLSRRLLATQYCDEKLATIIYSDEEYEAYYQKSKDTLDKLTFRIFTLTEDNLPASSQAATEEEVLAEIEALANSFANGLTTEQQFIDRAVSYAPESDREKYRSPSATLARNVSGANLGNTTMKEWLFDEARVTGDVAVHKTSSSAYSVCYFIDRGRDENPLASMRHILLSVTTTDEGSDEARVFDAINGIYQQWETEGFTEDSFIALASEHTEDPGSKSTGGLYEAFARGTMVSEIDDWLYAADRKKGDHAIIKTSYGYHLVWFLGYGEISWKNDLLSTMQDDDYYELLASLQKKYTVSYSENHRDILGND